MRGVLSHSGRLVSRHPRDRPPPRRKPLQRLGWWLEPPRPGFARSLTALTALTDAIGVAASRTGAQMRIFVARFEGREARIVTTAEVRTRVQTRRGKASETESIRADKLKPGMTIRNPRSKRVVTIDVVRKMGKSVKTIKVPSTAGEFDSLWPQQVIEVLRP